VQIGAIGCNWVQLGGRWRTGDGWRNGGWDSNRSKQRKRRGAKIFLFFMAGFGRIRSHLVPFGPSLTVGDGDSSSQSGRQVGARGGVLRE